MFANFDIKSLAFASCKYEKIAVTVTTVASTIPRMRLSTSFFSPYEMKHKTAPNQRRHAKKSKSFSRNLTHSGFAAGGVSALGPFSARRCSRSAWLRPYRKYKLCLVLKKVSSIFFSYGYGSNIVGSAGGLVRYTDRRTLSLSLYLLPYFSAHSVTVI